MSILALRDFTPDPKAPERIRDTDALRRKLLSDRECRAHGGSASDPHHLIFKSHGGDDVEDNIVPLCHDCHMRFHRADYLRIGPGPIPRSERRTIAGRFPRGVTIKEALIVAEARDVGREIGLNLAREEVLYVIGKMGREPGLDYLRRRYSWSRGAWERKHGPLGWSSWS
jgi:hypothetical protein